MDLFAVTVSWVPDDVAVHFQAIMHFSAVVLACDPDDARQEVLDFCSQHYNASKLFIKTRVRKV